MYATIRCLLREMLSAVVAWLVKRNLSFPCTVLQTGCQMEMCRCQASNLKVCVSSTVRVDVKQTEFDSEPGSKI